MKINRVIHKGFSIKFCHEHDEVYASIFYCYGNIVNVWYCGKDVWSDRDDVRDWLYQSNALGSVTPDNIHHMSELNFGQWLETYCWESARLHFLEVWEEIEKEIE